MMSVGICECLHLNHKTYKTENPTKQMSQSVLLFFAPFFPSLEPLLLQSSRSFEENLLTIARDFSFYSVFPIYFVFAFASHFAERGEWGGVRWEMGVFLGGTRGR